MHLSVKLKSDDFGDLLSLARPYTDSGIVQRLMDDLVSAFEDRIKTRLADDLVKTRIDISSPLSNDGLGNVLQVIGREVLEKRGVQIARFDLQLDTAPGMELDEFLLEQPIVCGFYSYGSWVPSLPKIRRHKTMKTRERYFIKTQGFWLPLELLPFDEKQINTCDCPLHFLTPKVSNNNSSLYIIWACNICGVEYTCECFRGVMETVSKLRWEAKIPDFLTDTRHGLGNASETERNVILNSSHGPGSSLRTAKKHLQSVEYRNGICHFCREIPLTLTYQKYAGTVIKHYRPYIMAEAIRSHISCRDAENAVRDRLGIPHIGEGWVSETHLDSIIKMLFPQYQIERETSPKWLRPMRFDIYMPEVRVAIEYQGLQHYRPVERFGGEKGFQKTKKRDALKRKKAAAAGVLVVEFKYNEDLSEKEVFGRVSKAIRAQKNAF
ncbi:MAG: hypothetical protein IID52_04630 [Proteobacteria bacterium]|nr:hypothetical protein [Pseudomonadota bacterium]